MNDDIDLDDKDFDDLLNEPVGKITAPKSLPAGTWEFVVLNGKYTKGKGDGNGPKAIALFQVKPVKAGDDVSEVVLEDFSEEDIADAKVFHRINVWEKADRYNIVRFLTTIGFDVAESELGLQDAVKAAKGYRFTAVVTYRPNPQDEDRPYVDLKEIQPVE